MHRSCFTCSKCAKLLYIGLYKVAETETYAAKCEFECLEHEKEEFLATLLVEAPGSQHDNDCGKTEISDAPHVEACCDPSVDQYKNTDIEESISAAMLTEIDESLKTPTERGSSISVLNEPSATPGLVEHCDTNQLLDQSDVKKCENFLPVKEQQPDAGDLFTDENSSNVLFVSALEEQPVVKDISGVTVEVETFEDNKNDATCENVDCNSQGNFKTLWLR